METTESFNKNDKQQNFNQIKGEISELNGGEKFCSVTLKLGHENPRYLNVIIKKIMFDTIEKDFKITDKVLIHFYATSRKKNERWYTMINLLQINKLS